MLSSSKFVSKSAGVKGKMQCSAGMRRLDSDAQYHQHLGEEDDTVITQSVCASFPSIFVCQDKRWGGLFGMKKGIQHIGRDLLQILGSLGGASQHDIAQCRAMTYAATTPPIVLAQTTIVSVLNLTWAHIITWYTTRQPKCIHLAAFEQVCSIYSSQDPRRNRAVVALTTNIVSSAVA